MQLVWANVENIIYCLLSFQEAHYYLQAQNWLFKKLWKNNNGVSCCFKKNKMDENIRVKTRACNDVLHTQTYANNFNTGKTWGGGGHSISVWNILFLKQTLEYKTSTGYDWHFLIFIYIFIFLYNTWKCKQAKYNW